MRFVFLVPDRYPKSFFDQLEKLVHLSHSRHLADWVRLHLMPVDQAHGGTLNLMRHCAVARSCGVDAVLATMRGQDSYKTYGLYDLPFIRWADRRPDDICIVPEFVTELIDSVKGFAVAYLQVPLHTRNNFNYKDKRVALWTDSPFMQDLCRTVYPEKTAEIVPNIIDNQQFPFIPQSQRQAGVVFAFPRKGAEFITAIEAHYKDMGGTYWQIERIDGLSIYQLAKEFRRPQVFLASAESEGCALPPQEAMASGIVVVGKTAKGANFCMQHRQSAMIAETPEEAARCLIELENTQLRDMLSHNAYEHISQYFPQEEPKQFWQRTIAYYQSAPLQRPLQTAR